MYHHILKKILGLLIEACTQEPVIMGKIYIIEMGGNYSLMLTSFGQIPLWESKIFFVDLWSTRISIIFTSLPQKKNISIFSNYNPLKVVYRSGKHNVLSLTEIKNKFPSSFTHILHVKCTVLRDCIDELLLISK